MLSGLDTTMYVIPIEDVERYVLWPPTFGPFVLRSERSTRTTLS